MSNEPSSPRIAIIGAGPGGISSAVRLREAGFTDVVIYEKADGVGGTWWNNHYPGLECDVPSHAYSFSFALKPDWSKPYARQPEIQAYLAEVVDRFDLWPLIRVGTPIRSAHWDDTSSTWRLVTAQGDEHTADVLISSQGMFGQLRWPDIDGRDTFAGRSFHSGAWPKESLAGRRVAVIGSAASAVQFVPEIATEVEHLVLFQRSANWVLPKEDTPFTAERIEELSTNPEALAAYRAELMDWVGTNPPFANPDSIAAAEEAGRANIAVVTDPDLRAKLTPTTPWGCQRPLFSNVYYPTFNRPNVELVTDAIVRITPDGVVTADGTEHEVDTIVYATGYETTKYVSTIDVYGCEGRSIHDAWSDGAQAYLGITTSGFPNLFMLYGPNTNAGSIIGMIEYQVGYVVRMVERMQAEGITWVDVRPEAMAAYNDALQVDLEKVTVWHAGCHQYYRGPTGRIVTQWPHSMYAYGDRLAQPDPDGTYATGLGAAR
jgi:cation diffusion facilitator CzcD-associated flavoprotein CzcO